MNQQLKAMKDRTDTDPRQGFCSAPGSLLLRRPGPVPIGLSNANPVRLTFRVSGFRVFAKVSLVSKRRQIDEQCMVQSVDKSVCTVLDSLLSHICPYTSHQLDWQISTNVPALCPVDARLATLEAVVGAAIDCLGVCDIMCEEDAKDYVLGWMAALSKVEPAAASSSLYISGRKQGESSVDTMDELFGLCQVVTNPFVEQMKPVYEDVGSKCWSFSEALYREKDEKGSLWEAITEAVEGGVKNVCSASGYSQSLIALIDDFMRFREESGIRAAVVQDYGPNVCILYEKSLRNEELLFEWLDSRVDVIRRISSNPSREARRLVYGKRLFDSFMTGGLVANVAKRACIVLSGKRFCGKSWLAKKLEEALGIKEFTLAETIKRNYCKLAGIAFESLLQDRELKEQHRDRLVAYSEAQIAKDQLVWNWSLWQRVQEMDERIVVVSDLRRGHELDFFQRMTECFHVRVSCSEEVREQRGWTQTVVDQSVSETGLDNAAFDYCFESDKSMKDTKLLQALLDVILQKYISRIPLAATSSQEQAEPPTTNQNQARTTVSSQAA